MIEVSIMNQAQVIFNGKANTVIVPGDYGEFEVLPFHWPIVSLLTKGEIIVDNMGFPVSKGIVRFSGEKLVALVEL
jgi:F0F1-type ATP synthase epsilon subunit